jgi:predicted transcriptional regulator
VQQELYINHYSRKEYPMDIESNAIHHADPDTTDRVSDQLSLSQVATEVDLCMEPVTKYLTQHEFALRVYSLKLAKVETTLYNVDERLNRKLACDLAEVEQAIRRLAQWQDDHAQQDDHSTPLTDQLQELTDRLDEVEYKADNPDEQWDPHALRDTVSELVDEYVRDNLADAVQDILNRATVDIQARIIT